MKLDNFGPLLKAWRKGKGLSLGQLAIRSGYDKAVLSKMENGKHGLKLEDLEAIARSGGDLPQKLVLQYLRERYPDFDQAVRDTAAG